MKDWDTPVIELYAMHEAEISMSEDGPLWSFVKDQAEKIMKIVNWKF